MTSTNTKKKRLALDMYVLGQDVKTGVYRVCDELFPRLAKDARFEPRYFIRAGFEKEALAYMTSHQLPGSLHDAPEVQPSDDADILLSPFGVAPANWRDDPKILHAHIVYDLIAIQMPHLFHPDAAAEVHNIMSSLNEHSVIFAISDSTKRELLEYRPDLKPDQVTVIPLAAGKNFQPCHDAAKDADIRKRYGIPPDAPYVLSLATLEIRKNLDQVVKAFIRFLDQHGENNHHLVLSGMSGWKLERLNHALASAGRWRNRIILTGFVDDEDLSSLYSGADCFIYLSRYEGFGLPPLEAMACGSPVICSNNSSLPEVVGDAGLMFDADDVDGVAQAIQRITSSTTYRSELSAKGIERAKKFNWDECAAIVADTLLKSHELCEQRMVQRKETNKQSPAGITGYGNGAQGQSFARSDVAPTPTSGPSWPVWTDALPVTSSVYRVEGGLRKQGKLKSGSRELPLVSFVTIVRNNVATLERTIESVRKQTYANVEHIILDGASTDGTLDIIAKHAHHLDYFVSEPDAGLYDALNKAVPLSRGQLICILNSDDWLEPNAAEIVIRHEKSGEGNEVLLTAARVLSGQVTHNWSPAFIHPGSYFMCPDACHNAMYATREAYEKSGPYDSSYKIAADSKWILSCMDAGTIFTYTQEATVNYSLGGTSSNIYRHTLECMRIVQERFAFLTPADVRGLYHCFFALGNTTTTYPFDRPANLTKFLREIIVRHGMHADFVNALAWASVSKLDHPSDRQKLAKKTRGTRLKDAVKRRLQRHPRLFRFVQRLHKRFNRGWF